MYQKTVLIGNLGADPEMRTTSTGKVTTELRVATSFGSGENAKTEWHRVIAWEKLAENAGKFLKKGSKVFVEGRIQYRTYDDKDGNKRYITEIVAHEIKFLDGKPSGGASEASDDLPF
jgi:single-strand DNA-binding protein